MPNSNPDTAVTMKRAIYSMQKKLFKEQISQKKKSNLDIYDLIITYMKEPETRQTWLYLLSICRRYKYDLWDIEEVREELINDLGDQYATIIFSSSDMVTIGAHFTGEYKPKKGAGKNVIEDVF